MGYIYVYLYLLLTRKAFHLVTLGAKKCPPVNDGALRKLPLTDSSDAYWHRQPQ